MKPLTEQVRGAAQAPLESIKSELFGRDRQRLAAFRRVDDPHGHGLALHEAGDARGAQDRDMDEDVLAAVVRLHEAEALVLVEPLHLAGDGDGGRRIWGHAAWRTRAVERTLRRALGGAGCIHLKHAVDLLTFQAVRHLYFQLGTWRHGLIPGRLQRADMQERVSGTVR